MTDMQRYDFDLPKQQIAQQPLPQRTDAKLMLVDRDSGEIDHAYIRDLPELVQPGDAMVLNDSRVLPARLSGYRVNTGGRWQGLYLAEDVGTGVWEVLTKTRGKLQAGEAIIVQDRHGRDALTLRCVARTDEGHLLVKPEPDGWADSAESTVELLERCGRVSLPPYIRDGQMVDDDLKNYQTVFAQHPGSVAAPTAGLHFTEPLLQRLRQNQVSLARVTLHVGIGTFRPITADSLEQHQMHSEWGQLSEQACQLIAQARRRGGRVIAVGSTSVRVLESAATAQQRRRAELPAGSAPPAAAEASQPLGPWSGQTDLFIRPGYRFAACDAMLTNFHLPRSSLLVMVSAFAGHELIMRAYRQAIAAGYRFFSYGDAMLIR